MSPDPIHYAGLSSTAASASVNRRFVADHNDGGNPDVSEQRLPPLRAVTSRSPHPASPLSQSSDTTHDLEAESPFTSSASRSPPVRPLASLSLSQPDTASSASTEPSSISHRRTNPRRKRRASGTGPFPSPLPSTSANSRYSWLMDLSPHLFPSRIVQRSGMRPFEWINTVDDTSPVTYLHKARNVVHPSAAGEEPEYDNTEDCCQCEQLSQCVDGQCACSCYTKAQHTRDGLVTKSPPLDAVITECNDNCSCTRWRGKQQCLNRVVQSAPVNPAHRLLVFHTGTRGWGALTLQPIPARQYVCEYVGEVISEALAESRSDKFLFSPDTKLITQGRFLLSSNLEPPSLDATQIGHIARFINHSCQPNCSVKQVLIEGREWLKPHFAFFANRHIAAGEELTINYSYSEEAMLRLFNGPCKCDHCEGRQDEDGAEVEAQHDADSGDERGRNATQNGSRKRQALG